jgi:hypothetical protein
MSSSPSKVVRMMTRAAGNSARSALVASAPPITGMRKSISTTSGLCAR